MKISKSFKIYIHIFAAFFFAQQLLSETNYSKNIVLHKEPLEIKELKFKDFNLNDVDLTEKKGNIMIINFWATWCLPCKKEMPSLERLSKEYPEIMIYPVNLEKPNQDKTLKFFADKDLINLIGFISSESIKIRKIESKIKANKENFCFVPLTKNAERIAIPTSSRCVFIIQILN